MLLTLVIDNEGIEEAEVRNTGRSGLCQLESDLENLKAMVLPLDMVITEWVLARQAGLEELHRHFVTLLEESEKIH